MVPVHITQPIIFFLCVYTELKLHRAVVTFAGLSYDQKQLVCAFTSMTIYHT